MRQFLVSLALALTCALSSLSLSAGAATRGAVVYDVPDFGPGAPAGIVFADVLQQATGWQSTTPDALSLDSNGDLRALRPGQSAQRVVYTSEAYPAGDYTLLYDGAGRFDVAGGTIVASSPGRATVRVGPNAGSGLVLHLSAMDAANPVRNVHLVLPGFEATYATQPFVPAFVRSLQGRSVLRFAQWMNADTFVDSIFWIQRPRVARVTQLAPNGVAPEYMILLANLTGASPWFTLPAGASDAYAYGFAALVHRTLDPRLHPVFQYGNEIWNPATPSNGYARMAARNVGISGDPSRAALEWYTRRSARLFSIVRAAFGSNAAAVVRAASGPLPGSSRNAAAVDAFVLQSLSGQVDAFAFPVAEPADLAAAQRLVPSAQLALYGYATGAAAAPAQPAAQLQPLGNAHLVLGTDRPGAVERHTRPPQPAGSAPAPLSAPAELDLGGRPGVAGALGIPLPKIDPAGEGTLDWIDLRSGALATRKTTANPQLRVAAQSGGAYAITVPADVSERILRVYVTVDHAQGALSATLGGSTYTDASLSERNGTRAGVYTLVYRAATPGQSLTVHFAPQAPSGGSVSVQAATVNGFPQPVRPPTDEALYHNDLWRTGWNTNETALTPATVSASLTQVQTLTVDGNVLAQPLYLAQYTVGGAPHNVLVVATENDTVYEFDADSGAVLNQVSLGKSQSSNDVGCGDIQPTYGITSTPVINRATGTIYVVAATEPTSYNFHTTIHALDIATLADKVTPVDIAASVKLNNGSTLSFNPQNQYNRPGLVWANNSLYIGVGSHCDNDAGAIGGWLLRYNASLTQTAVFSTIADPDGDCNGESLSSIWMAGFAPAVDGTGNLYFATGNGSFNANAGGHDYGESVMKLRPDLTRVLSTFTPSDYNNLNCGDGDFGSGGAMLVPSSQPPLLVAMGKASVLYLLNTASLGGWSSNDAGALQVINAGGGGVWGGPAFYNGPTGAFVYYQSGGAGLQAYRVSYGGSPLRPVPGSRAQPAASASGPQLILSSTGTSGAGYGGSTPVVSSNGQLPHTGVVWLVRRGAGQLYLEAYDALNVHTPLFSAVAGSWSNPANNGFVTPLVANGKVYVPGTNAVTVFGL